MTRRHDIEALRIVSAFAVVWYHSGAPGHDAAYAGLTMFLMLSAYLGASTTVGGTWSPRRRVQRLLVPWALWFGVYAALNLFRGRALVPLEHGLLAGILAGPSVHLWYLPFMFFCLLVLDALRARVRGPTLAIGSFVLLILLFQTTAWWRLESMALGYPVAQYAQAFPGVLIGIFLAGLGGFSRTVALSLIAALFAAALSAAPVSGIGVPYAITITVGAVIALGPFAAIQVPGITRLSDCTFGIYLVHILFLKLALKAAVPAGAAVAIVAFCLSALAIAWARWSMPRWSRYAT